MKTKQSRRNLILARAIAAICLAGASPNLFATPANGKVVAGEGKISQANANTTQIQQNSQSMVINWDSFNVGAQQQVNFVQPSSSAAALNRIFDQNPSQILGSINANGKVFLSNPNGLIFGANSVVNVHSLIASGMNIDAGEFMQGRYLLNSEGSTGSVINYGLINAATGGSVGLFGGHVANHGQIVANYGHVGMGSGKQMVLDFDGDGLLQFQIDESLLSDTGGNENGVHNTGQIQANAGQVVLQGDVAAGVFTNVVNNEGLISATKIVNEGGVIRLKSSGRTISSGKIVATSQNAQGGSVQILGNQVGLMDGAKVDVSGGKGGGVVLIGGDYQGKGDTQTAAVTYFDQNATVLADALQQGDGGRVIVWADDTTWFNGDISAKGGKTSGNGGFIETSGKQNLLFRGNADTSAVHGQSGTLLLDPERVTIVGGAGGAEDAQLDDSEILFDDPGSPEDVEYTISEQKIELIGTSNSITIQATSEINVSGSFNNNVNGEGNKVLFIQGGSLTLQTRNNISTDDTSSTLDTTPEINLVNSNLDEIRVQNGSIWIEAGTVGTATAPIDLSGLKLTTGQNASAVDNGTGGNINIITNGSLTMDSSIIANNGSLSISIGSGDISNSESIRVGSTTTLTAGAGAISLTASTNDFGGAVSASGSGISLSDANSIVLGDIDDGGAFTVIAGGTGTINQTAAGATGDNINVVGISSLMATNNSITLAASTNDFVGEVTLDGGTSVSIVDANDLTLAAPTLAVDTAFSAIAEKTLTLPVAAINTGTGDLQLTSKDGSLTTAGALSTTSGAITLTGSGGVSIGHNITTAAGGALTLSSTDNAINQSTGTITVGDTTTLSAGAGSISLTENTNDFGGAVSASGSGISLSDANSIVLGDIDDGGAFTVIAGGTGTINQTAAGATGDNINVVGISSLTATDNSITLAASTNDFVGEVTLDGGTSVSIVDANDLTLAAPTLAVDTAFSAIAEKTLTLPVAAINTGTGDLQLTSKDGSLTTAGALSTTSGAITLTGSGGVSIGHNITTAAGGTLTLSSTNNAINQSTGTITVGDTTTLSAGAGSISLTENTNDFGGAVSASGSGISLSDANSIVLGDIDDGGAFTVKAGGTGTINQTAAGATGDNINVVGISSLTATDNSITLAASTNDFVGEVTLDGGTSVSIVDANDLTLAAPTLAVDTAFSAIAEKTLTLPVAAINTGTGDLQLTSKDGSLTTAGALSTTSGAITLTGSGGVSIGHNITTAAGGTLTLSSTNNAINQSTGTITVGDTTTLSAGAGSISLTENTNDFGGAVSASGSGISLSDANSIVLGDIDDGGAFTVIAGGTGTINQTAAGATGDNINVVGTSSLTATDNSITLAASTNDFGGAVSASGSDISLSDANSIVLGDIDDGGALTVIAGGTGTINQTAAGATGDNINVVGISSLTATDNSITLAASTNDFVGEVTLDGGTSVSIVDANDLTLAAPTLAVDTAFSAIAEKTLTLPVAAINTGTGDLQLTSKDGSLTTAGALSTTSGAITLTGSGGVSIGHNITTAAGGTLTLSSTNNAINQSTGTITVGDATTLSAGAGSISLTENTNDFGGAVSASGSGISLSDANSIVLGDIDDGGAFTVIAGGTGTINQTAAGATGDNINVVGTSSLTATDNSITLAASTNDFVGEVTLDGGASVSIVDANDLTLAAPTLAVDTAFSAIAEKTLTLPVAAINTGTGDLQLTSKDGSLTTAGALSTTSGTITLTGSGGVSIGHNITTNMVSGTVTLIASNAGTINGSGTITSSQISLQNSNGIGSSTNALNTASSNIDFSTAISGDVFLSNNSSAGLIIEGSTDGEINVVETLAGITLNALSSGGNNITIDANTDLNINDVINAGSAGLALTAGSSINGGSLITAGALTTQANSGIGNITPLLTSASSLNFTNTSNAVELTGSATDWVVEGNAGSGNIVLTNNTANIRLGHLQTTGDITLNSTSGGIFDDNADTLNLSAATATLNTASGIGAADGIETAIATLVFDNTTASTVQLINSSVSALGIEGSNAGGTILINQSVSNGSLNVNANLISSGGDIELIADNISLSAGTVDSGVGIVTLNTASNSSAIQIGGLAPSFGVDLLNNIKTSGGLTIASSTHQGGITINNTINTTATVTAGEVKLLNDADIIINGSVTNAVETSLVSGNGNVVINGELNSAMDINLQTSAGDIQFGNNALLHSDAQINFFTSTPVTGSGAVTIEAANLSVGTEMILDGNTSINVDSLSIDSNVSTTSGDLNIESTGTIALGSGVVLTSASDIDLTAFDTSGDLILDAGGTVKFAADSTVGGNLALTAADLNLDAITALTVAVGTITLSDQAGGNGIALGTFVNNYSNLSVSEYEKLVAPSIVIRSDNEVTLSGTFNPAATTPPVDLAIDTNNLVMAGSTTIALGGNLDLVDSEVNVTNGGKLTIDIDGQFMMNDGSITSTNNISIDAAAGITMEGLATEIVSNNHSIEVTTATGDVLLGLLNAGAANVSVTASGGDILNNNGVFQDVTLSNTNVYANNVTLSAQDRIGVSSTDAITLDADPNGNINLSFGADNAYINNLSSSRINNNGSGNVIVGLIFSNQILGVGHNIGLGGTEEEFNFVYAGENTDADNTSNISVLGLSTLALLADEEDEEVISSMIPSVPVMIRTLDGWRFESPSRQQRLDQFKQNKKKGFKNIDWF